MAEAPRPDPRQEFELAIGEGRCRLSEDCVRAIREALSAASRSVTAPLWQPMDTAPKDGRDILCLFSMTLDGVVHYDDCEVLSWWPNWHGEGKGSWVLCDDFDAKFNPDGVHDTPPTADWDPTHWMPLPPPPGAPLAAASSGGPEHRTPDESRSPDGDGPAASSSASETDGTIVPAPQERRRMDARSATEARSIAGSEPADSPPFSSGSNDGTELLGDYECGRAYGYAEEVEKRFKPIAECGARVATESAILADLQCIIRSGRYPHLHPWTLPSTGGYVRYGFYRERWAFEALQWLEGATLGPERDWMQGLLFGYRPDVIQRFMASQAGQRPAEPADSDSLAAASSGGPPTSSDRNEWRLDDRGLLDDVVVDNVATFRLERMGHNHIWGAVYRRDGSRTVFNVFGDRRAKVSLTHEIDQEAKGSSGGPPTEGLDMEPIKARERMATSGPWHAENVESREDGEDGCAWGVVSGDTVVIVHDFVGPTDAEFIAHARRDIPALIAEIERLRGSAPRAQTPQEDDLTAKYHELLYAVGNKYPGESRHETALRYIRRAEEPNGIAAAAPRPQEPTC